MPLQNNTPPHPSHYNMIPVQLLVNNKLHKQSSCSTWWRMLQTLGHWTQHRAQWLRQWPQSNLIEREIKRDRLQSLQFQWNLAPHKALRCFNDQSCWYTRTIHDIRCIKWEQRKMPGAPMIDMGFLIKRRRPLMPAYLLRQPADHSRTTYSVPKNSTSTISCGAQCKTQSKGYMNPLVLRLSLWNTYEGMWK